MKKLQYLLSFFFKVYLYILFYLSIFFSIPWLSIYCMDMFIIWDLLILKYYILIYLEKNSNTLFIFTVFSLFDLWLISLINSTQILYMLHVKWMLLMDNDAKLRQGIQLCSLFLREPRVRLTKSTFLFSLGFFFLGYRKS